MKDKNKITSHDSGDSGAVGGPARKPYVRAELKVYGTVVALTHTVGMKGTVADGGGAPGMSKTS